MRFLQTHRYIFIILFSLIGLAISLLLTSPSFTAILMKLYFVIIGCYLIYLQVIETLRPVDGLTPLRWQILLTLVISVVTQVPSIYYQYLRIAGIDSPVLREVVTITANFSLIAIMVLLVLIFNFKKRS